MRSCCSWIAGVALATIVAAVPASGQTAQISACVNNGTTKIVPAGTTCPNGQTLVSWNVTGPQGPTGPTGPTGPQGPGVSGYSVLGDQVFFLAVDPITSVPQPPVLMTAYCHDGDIVTGGGFWNWNAGGGGDRDNVLVSESSATGLWQYPDPEPGDNQPVGGWKVRAQNRSPDRVLIVSATVQCLHVGS
jgi:hypothetical protein